jgi:hypothetical protein
MSENGVADATHQSCSRYLELWRVISSCPGEKKLAEYSAELQKGKLEGDLLVPIVFTDTEKHELL